MRVIGLGAILLLASGCTAVEEVPALMTQVRQYVGAPAQAFLFPLASDGLRADLEAFAHIDRIEDAGATLLLPNGTSLTIEIPQWTREEANGTFSARFEAPIHIDASIDARVVLKDGRTFTRSDIRWLDHTVTPWQMSSSVQPRADGRSYATFTLFEYKDGARHLEYGSRDASTVVQRSISQTQEWETHVTLASGESTTLREHPHPAGSYVLVLPEGVVRMEAAYRVVLDDGMILDDSLGGRASWPPRLPVEYP